MTTPPPESLDTSKEAGRLLVRGLRELSPQQRMLLVEQWSRDLRVLAAAGLRRRHPDADEVELKIRLGRLLYGDGVVDDAARACGARPRVVNGALDLTVQVCAVLERLGIEHVVGGSIASSLVGEPRATIDVDIAVRLSGDRIPGLVVAFEDDFYLSGDAVREAVARRGSFNLIHLETMQKVDLFVLGDEPLDVGQLGRRQRLEVAPGTELWVGSPEDQILRKLWWFRLGGEVSERQWRDVVAILRVQASALDDDYLDDTAAAADLVGLLARARGEAETSS